MKDDDNIFTPHGMRKIIAKTAKKKNNTLLAVIDDVWYIKIDSHKIEEPLGLFFHGDLDNLNEAISLMHKYLREYDLFSLITLPKPDEMTYKDLLLVEQHKKLKRIKELTLSMLKRMEDI